MLPFKKLFRSEPAPEVKDEHDSEAPDTEVDSQGMQKSLEDEYREFILQQLERGGVSLDCVTVEVRGVGLAADQLPIYLGMLRLAKWERRSALRLLLGLPILEAKVRRETTSSWIVDVSHFGGLWLHASGQLQDSTAMQELRTLVLDIEHNDNASDSGGAVWTLPTEIGRL